MPILIIGLKCVFILLGLITLLIGKFIYPNYILKKAKRNISDKPNYIIGCRITLYGLGFYYIVFGIALLFIKGWPMTATYFS